MERPFVYKKPSTGRKNRDGVIRCNQKFAAFRKNIYFCSVMTKAKQKSRTVKKQKIMKKIAFLLFAALLSTTTITAQKTVVSMRQSDEKVFNTVEVMPEFPGGVDSLMTFLMRTIKYPKEAMDKGIQGRVVVRFVVEKDGQVSEPEILRSVFPVFNEEALRVIRCMPKWKPGMQSGKVVRVFFTLPISFRLS